MTAIPTFGVLAARLAAQGYDPVPIIPGEKKPRPKAWPEGGFAARAAEFATDYTGILTCYTPAADIDVSNEALVREIEGILLDVLDCHEKPPPARIGMAPRRLLMFRTEEPFGKFSTAEYELTTDPVIEGKTKYSKVEILGDGQQFVAFAVHPYTRNPYEWNGGGDPLTLRRDQLPTLDERQAAEFIDRADKVLAKHGKRVNRPRIRQCTEERKSNPKQRADDPAQLREALAAIPNDDEHFDDWLDMLLAVKGALGDGGLDAFLAWSAKSKKHSEPFTRREWEKAKPKYRGAGSVFWLAKKHGWSPVLQMEKFDDPVELSLVRTETQDGVALGFAHAFKGRLRFTAILGKWHEWDGKRWAVEETRKAFDYARRMARAANGRNRQNMATYNFVNGVEKFAQADRAFAVLPATWDADNYLLNTPEGTIDLRDGAMRPHRQDDHITKITNVAPDPSGGAIFRMFLDEITLGDEGLQEFLKRALGAMLSGAVEEHWLMFWTGTGRNGKNTLGDLVAYILGDYAKAIPSETLMSFGNNDRHPTELANLVGCRVAISSEVESGAHWHESRINSLTGDAMISGRFMRQDFFEFPRRHKHLIYGNHRPQVRSATPALKSRLKIVPFRASFIGREDADLPRRLRLEAPYVLAWLIEGHAEWLAASNKIGSCAAVDEENREFFASQSTVEMWIEERVDVVNQERDANQWLKSGDLYADYRDWKQARGEGPVSQTRWAETMRARFDRISSNGSRYVGALLRPKV